MMIFLGLPSPPKSAMNSAHSCGARAAAQNVPPRPPAHAKGRDRARPRSARVAREGWNATFSSFSSALQ